MESWVAHICILVLLLVYDIGQVPELFQASVSLTKMVMLTLSSDCCEDLVNFYVIRKALKNSYVLERLGGSVS